MRRSTLSLTPTASFQRTSLGGTSRIRSSRYPAKKQVAKQWKDKETQSKGKGNISIAIRREASDLSYLSMDDLANLVDKAMDALKEDALSRDANEYKPIRDAVAHTALL